MSYKFVIYCFRKVIRKPHRGVVTRWNSEYLEVRHSNICMGDLQMALSEMLDPETGIDRKLLKDVHGEPVDRNDLMFVPNELNMLRQYECAAEPVMKLSEFFQHSAPMVHQVLVVLRARIQEMREPTFLMYGDISYNENLSVLTDRKKTEIIGSDAEKEQHGATVQPMIEEIYDFRRQFADDLESRCGLTFERDGVTYDPDDLPTDIALGCLLNPLVGGKSRLVNNGVMTPEQFDNAEKELVGRLQAMRESETGHRALLCTSTSTDHPPDPNDDVYDNPISTEHQEAFNEWNAYCRLTKGGRFFPKRFKTDNNLLAIGDIRFGTVESRGDDMVAPIGSVFKKCNHADFITNGYYDLVSFLTFNKEAFPFIYKLACCLCSLRTCEVGCEKFFSIAGYVSNPRRTRLNVDNYERIAMLKRNMQQIYIDEEWVLQEYMRNDEQKLWDAQETRDDTAATALETEIYNEDLGLSPDQEIESDQDVIESDSESDTSTDTE